MYAAASAHTEVTKDQDGEASVHTEVTEDLYTYASDLHEVPEDHEVPSAGYRYERNTHQTLEYVRTMDKYVKSIDKNDKNTWRTIYEAIGAPYFG